MRFRKDNHRYMFWPITIYLVDRVSGNTVGWHYVQRGNERCLFDETGEGNMPYYRKVFSQVFRLWKIRVVFGKSIR